MLRRPGQVLEKNAQPVFDMDIVADPGLQAGEIALAEYEEH